MSKAFIAVSSVTYAIKGRDILLKNGFNNVYFQRVQGLTENGCGYGIYIDDNTDLAVNILKSAMVPIIEIRRADAK